MKQTSPLLCRDDSVLLLLLTIALEEIHGKPGESPERSAQNHRGASKTKNKSPQFVQSGAHKTGRHGGTSFKYSVILYLTDFSILTEARVKFQEDLRYWILGETSAVKGVMHLIL